MSSHFSNESQIVDQPNKDLSKTYFEWSKLLENQKNVLAIQNKLAQLNEILSNLYSQKNDSLKKVQQHLDSTNTSTGEKKLQSKSLKTVEHIAQKSPRQKEPRNEAQAEVPQKDLNQIESLIKEREASIQTTKNQLSHHQIQTYEIQRTIHPNPQIRNLILVILLKTSEPSLTQFRNDAIQITENPSLDPIQKMKKLRLIHQKIQQKIKDAQDQRKEPYCIDKPFKKALEEYSRAINFFMMSSFIVGFFLASKDKSHAIDETLPFLFEITFRDYLLQNADLTLYLAIIFFVFNIFYTKLWSSTVPEAKKKEQRNAFIRYTLLVLEILLTLAVVLILIVKVGWILVGLYLFLGHVNFAKCSDKLVGYCLIQFTVYFVYTWYLVIKELFKITAQKAKEKQDSEIANKNDQIEVHQNKVSELKSVLSKSTLLYTNLDDFQFMLNKILIWQLVGFILELILWAKDHSVGIETAFMLGNYTYRNWMLADALINGVFYFYFLGHWYSLVKRGYDFPVWRRQEKGVFQFESKFFSEGIVQSTVVVIAFFVKILSLGVGLSSLYNDVDLEKCSSVLILFLITYFTQNVFIIVQTSSIFRNGQRAKDKLIVQAENEGAQRGENPKLEEKQKIEQRKKQL